MQIRCRHNYSTYTLNGNDQSSSNSIIGNAVLVEREIDQVYMPFGGFVLDKNLAIYEPLIANILNIEAYKSSSDMFGNWVELPKNSKVVGIKISGQYFALCKDDQLLLANP